jgi:hypothetical protein
MNRLLALIAILGLTLPVGFGLSACTKKEKPAEKENDIVQEKDKEEDKKEEEKEKEKEEEKEKEKEEEKEKQGFSFEGITVVYEDKEFVGDTDEISYWLKRWREINIKTDGTWEFYSNEYWWDNDKQEMVKGGEGDYSYVLGTDEWGNEITELSWKEIEDDEYEYLFTMKGSHLSKFGYWSEEDGFVEVETVKHEYERYYGAYFKEDGSLYFILLELDEDGKFIPYYDHEYVDYTFMQK